MFLSSHLQQSHGTCCSHSCCLPVVGHNCQQTAYMGHSQEMQAHPLPGWFSRNNRHTAVPGSAIGVQENPAHSLPHSTGKEHVHEQSEIWRPLVSWNMVLSPQVTPGEVRRNPGGLLPLPPASCTQSFLHLPSKSYSANRARLLLPRLFSLKAQGTGRIKTKETLIAGFIPLQQKAPSEVVSGSLRRELISEPL